MSQVNGAKEDQSLWSEELLGSEIVKLVWANHRLVSLVVKTGEDKFIELRLLPYFCTEPEMIVLNSCK